MRSPILGSGYESLNVTSLSLWVLAKNLSEPPFSGAELMGPAQCVFSGAITPFWSIFNISLAGNVLTVGPAWYGALWAERVLLDAGWITWFPALIRASYPSRTSSDSYSSCRDSFSTVSYSWEMVISFHQSSISLVLSSFHFFMVIHLFKACSLVADGEQNWHSCLTAGPTCSQKAHHIYSVRWLKGGKSL